MYVRRGVLLSMLLVMVTSVPLPDASATTTQQPESGGDGGGGGGWWSTLWTLVRPWTWWRRSDTVPLPPPTPAGSVSTSSAGALKTSVRCDEQTCTTFTCSDGMCTSRTCGIYDTDMRGFCRQYNTSSVQVSKGGDAAQKPLQLEATLSAAAAVNNNITATTSSSASSLYISTVPSQSPPAASTTSNTGTSGKAATVPLSPLMSPPALK